MKQKLIDTACRLWREKSYNEVSVSQICKACGVTKGSFYYYFDAKSDILTACYRSLCDKYQTDALKKCMLTDSCIEKIRILLDIYNQAAMELGPELIRVIIYNTRDAGDDTVAKGNPYVRPEVYDMLLAACAHGQETGEIRGDESPEDLIEYLTAAATGMMLYWISLKKDFDINAFLKKTVELLLSAPRPC